MKISSFLCWIMQLQGGFDARFQVEEREVLREDDEQLGSNSDDDDDEVDLRSDIQRAIPDVSAAMQDLVKKILVRIEILFAQLLRKFSRVCALTY